MEQRPAATGDAHLPSGDECQPRIKFCRGRVETPPLQQGCHGTRRGVVATGIAQAGQGLADDRFIRPARRIETGEIRNELEQLRIPECIDLSAEWVFDERPPLALARIIRPAQCAGHGPSAGAQQDGAMLSARNARSLQRMGDLDPWCEGEGCAARGQSLISDRR